MELVGKSGGRQGNIYRHRYRSKYNGEDGEDVGSVVSILEGARHTVQVFGDFDGARVEFEGSNTQEPRNFVPISDYGVVEINGETLVDIGPIISHIRPVVKNMGENTSLDIVIVSRIA